MKQDIDDESSDELSDENSRVGLETDNAERFNDFEDNASGGKKMNKKRRMKISRWTRAMFRI